MGQTTDSVEDRIESTVADDDADVSADVVRRDAGVRLRTNVQAGSTAERVNVTAEVHARTLPELIDQLPTYRKVLMEQVEESRRVAQQNNE